MMPRAKQYSHLAAHDKKCLPLEHDDLALSVDSPPSMQAVGTRACYLFSRLAKVLRQNMRPLLSDILVRLQPHLAHILANPLPEAESAAKGARRHWQKMSALLP